MALVPVSRSDYRGWVRPDLQLPPALLREPWNGIPVDQATLLLDCEARRIYRGRIRSGSEALPVFVYIFRNQSWNRALRKPYAQRSHKMAELLTRNGFGTMDILAALSRSGQWLNWDSLLVAREIQDVYELPSSGNHVFQIHPVADLTPELFGRLAAELADFHSRGFYHGDLKTRHVLYSRSQGRFYFVDLEKAHYLPRLFWLAAAILAARDLVQLFASLPSSVPDNGSPLSKDRFLETYFQRRKLPARDRSQIQRVLRAYGPGGSLQQGKSVLKAVLNGSR